MPIIINSKFRPFSFQEMLQPVAMAALAHLALEDLYAELDTKASIWEKLKDSEIDKDVYQLYKAYSDALKSSSDLLALFGLTPSSRRAMLDMRARYSKDIAPIEQAWAERDRLMKVQQEMMLKDPTHMYRVNAGNVRLRDYMNNAGYDALTDNYSGALLTQQVGLAANNLKQVLTDRSKLRSIGLPYLYEREILKGVPIEKVLAVMAGDKEAAPILDKIVNDVIAASGIESWNNPEILEKAKAYARNGLYNAIGTTEFKDYTDNFSMQIAKQLAVLETQNRITRGNLPIDVHHLISPNQEGDEGSKMVSKLRSQLGISGHLNGVYGKTVDLGNLVAGRSDMYTYKFKNKDGGTSVRVFDSNGELLSRASVVAQGGNNVSKKALGEWYDSIYSTLSTNFTPNSKGKWDVGSISDQMKSISSGKGALTMGAMRINFGADNNKKALESLLPGLTSGDNTSIYEITSFTRDGKMNKGKRAKLSDFQDDKGNIIGSPMFYAAPNANTDGLVMKYNGKTYLIPREKLGSLGELVYNINIPALQRANQMKQDLISRYGESAYYNSNEGVDLEQIIDNYGAAYLRAAGTALGYSYELPKFGIKADNQSDI